MQNVIAETVNLIALISKTVPIPYIVSLWYAYLCYCFVVMCCHPELVIARVQSMSDAKIAEEQYMLKAVLAIVSTDT